MHDYTIRTNYKYGIKSIYFQSLAMGKKLSDVYGNDLQFINYHEC